MNLLATLSVKTKMPIIIVGLCLVTGLSLLVMTHIQTRTDTRSRIQEQFEGLAAARGQALAVELKNFENDLTLLATSPEIAGALGALSSAYRMIENPTEALQTAYIYSNPNPVGQRQAMDKAEGKDPYHRQHASLHPSMRNLLELRNLYDIFLFDTDLNNVYTVFKETDFAASFAEGPLAASGLGLALRTAEKAEAGTIVFSDFAPYAPSMNAPAAFIVARIDTKAGQPLGYVAFQLNTQTISNIMDRKDGLGETGAAYLVGLNEAGAPNTHFVLGSGLMQNQTEKSAAVSTILGQSQRTPQIEAALAGQTRFLEDIVLADGRNGFASTAIFEQFGMRWGIIIERDAGELFAAANGLMKELAMIGLAIIAVVAGVAFVFARSISVPIGRISGALDAIANGDLSVVIADAQRADELGVIARSTSGLMDKLVVAKLAEEERERLSAALHDVVETLSTGLQDLARGDLSRQITAPFPREYEALRHDFNMTLDRLSETIAQVVDVAQHIRTRSTEISAASQELSRRTENQAAALEETAAALDELTASVKSASDGAREVEGIVRQARNSADESGVVVQGAVKAMAEIEKSSEQISMIIGAIDDIAFQTNLLALNAGVEAARAGEAGKGFAVVASEVRALAQRSSTAAKEIKALIATSAQQVGRGVDQVGKAGTALHKIVASVANISTLVSTIASGAIEQSTGLAEINIGVMQLDQVTQQNAAMVDESAAVSRAMHQKATALAAMVAKFRIAGGGQGTSAEPIALSSFVPTDFTGEDNAPDDGDAPASFAPRKAATGNGAGVWQNF